jgi:YD repeat-containing protein
VDDRLWAAVAASHLRSLPDELLRDLLANAQRVHAPAGQPVHRAGEGQRHVELVVEGLVRVFASAPDGRTLTMRYCRTGALMGVLSLPVGSGSGRSIPDHCLPSPYQPARTMSTLTLPRGGVYAYTYNQLGGIATETDPNLKITTHSTDNEGRPTRTDTPADRAIVSRYDAAGRLWQSEAGGVVREFGYDNAGRLTSTKVAGVADTSATYNNRGLLASSTDHFGTTSYPLTPRRQLADRHRPPGSPKTTLV